MDQGPYGDLKGRLSHPPQHRLSPTAIDDVVEAYRGGATISQLAVQASIHRTTVAGGTVRSERLDYRVQFTTGCKKSAG
jgi:hypothetical protein